MPIQCDEGKSYRANRRRRVLLMPCIGAAILVIALMSLVSLAPAATPSFPDVPAGHQYSAAIAELASRGIIGGYTDGRFGPGDAVMRQQFAKMAVLSGGYPVTESDVCTFTDVPQSDASSLYPDNYIAVCAAKGITNGKTATTFDPTGKITRYQVVTMVVRMADNLQSGLLAAPTVAWQGNATWAADPTHGANAARAEYNGLLEGLDLSTLSPSGDMSRGEVAQVLHNLLAKLEPGTTTTDAVTTTTTEATTTTTEATTTTTSISTTTTTAAPGYENLGGNPAVGSSPAAASWGPGRLDLFIRGEDNALWHRAYSNGWGDWESLGGTLTSDPAAVSWGEGRIDVFARDQDNRLLHIAYAGGSWFSWQTLDYTLNSAPAACSPAPNMFGVCWRDEGNAVELLGYNQGAWFPWVSLPLSGSSAPACAATSMVSADVFATGFDGKVYWNHYYGAGWTPTQSLGGEAVSGPGACAWGSRLDVFVRGPLGNLWQKSYTSGSWSSWTALAGAMTFQGDPEAVNSGGRIDVFAVGADRAVWHKYFEAGEWKP